MREIELTQGKTALVDDSDFERLNQFKWFARKGTQTFYASRNSSKINGKHHFIHMHHEVIGNPLKGFEIDHVNGQGTDNRSENLRFATRRQNLQNRQNIKMSSEYPGVCWDKNRGKWIAGIRINGRIKFLGRFTDEKEAFEFYKQAVHDLGETIIGE